MTPIANIAVQYKAYKREPNFLILDPTAGPVPALFSGVFASYGLRCESTDLFYNHGDGLRNVFDYEKDGLNDMGIDMIAMNGPWGGGQFMACVEKVIELGCPTALVGPAGFKYTVSGATILSEHRPMFQMLVPPPKFVHNGEKKQVGEVDIYYFNFPDGFDGVVPDKHEYVFYKKLGDVGDGSADGAGLGDMDTGL